jgi:hypothetical protein
MHCATLNGWSASVRAPGGHIATVVAKCLPPGTTHWAGTSKLGGWRARQLRRWLLDHEDPGESLLLVGKSLGAWHMLTRVVNVLPRLEYRRIGLVTVDPCHPRFWDWAPDRSGDTLPLHRGKVDWACNLMSGEGSRPRGAHVDTLHEYTIPGADHFSITRHPWVRGEVEVMIGRLG